MFELEKEISGVCIRVSKNCTLVHVCEHLLPGLTEATLQTHWPSDKGFKHACTLPGQPW